MNNATIHPEHARVLIHDPLPAQQYLLRLAAPNCASNARPGNFIHLSCSNNAYDLKRPFSILKANADEGWIEILYKVVGKGTEKLRKVQCDESLHCLGPIGNSFTLSNKNTQPLLLGGGVGIPPILFFAQELKKKFDVRPFVIMGSEIPFPFKIQPSKLLMDALPSDTIASMTLLEDLSIPSRLSNKQGITGCFDGYIHELAEIWLQSLSPQTLSKVELFACGPSPMLAAVAKLSQNFSLPCQLSLEEYMACAVGGCAGCTVPIVDDTGTKQMKRVCVDGPVFSADSVYSRGHNT